MPSAVVVRAKGTAVAKMVSTRTVIVLAYYFPPLVGIASERAFAMTQALSELGWQPVVITPRSGFFHRALSVPEEPWPVVRTNSIELSRGLRRAYRIGSAASTPSDGEVTPVAGGRVADRLRGLVRDFVYVPDGQIGWLPFARRALQQNLETAGSRCVVLSTSVPYSAHLAAMSATRGRIPWVAEFRDPWTTGAHAGRSPHPARQRVNRALERRIVTRADHVIVTSHSTREDLLAAHPDLAPQRISVVTNGFVPAPDRRRPPPGEPMTILYAGTVNVGEDLAPVIAAFDRLDAAHPGSFRLRVMGPAERWDAWAAEGGRRPWLQIMGLVTPAEARAAMSESSALLLLQTHSAYDRILPGKAFEYIGVRRPILALISAQGELANLLTAHADARVVPREDPSLLDEQLRILLAEHQRGELQGPRVEEELTRPLTRREQAVQLSAVLDAVVRGETR
jgi:hypothetical protein